MRYSRWSDLAELQGIWRNPRFSLARKWKETAERIFLTLLFHSVLVVSAVLVLYVVLSLTILIAVLIYKLFVRLVS